MNEALRRMARQALRFLLPRFPHKQAAGLLLAVSALYGAFQICSLRELLWVAFSGRLPDSSYNDRFEDDFDRLWESLGKEVKDYALRVQMKQGGDNAQVQELPRGDS